MSNQPTIFVVATMDTKGEELAYLAECLTRLGVQVSLIDIGVQGPPTHPPTIRREQIWTSKQAPDQLDRGAAIAAMSRDLEEYVRRSYLSGDVQGLLGLGGSGGTALITPAMRALPIGIPKVMVSTVASGDVGPYVDCSDITMMYSVVDVAGLNSVSRQILGNAAHAIAGMVQHPLPPSPAKPTLGMTMFGVTTPCVTDVRQRLEAKGFDCLVFHATGTGGRAMEKLVEGDQIEGVLDITTTEVADEVVGGIFPARAERFDRLISKQVPLVVSVGAIDMVNFGAQATVPPPFRDRRLHVHNPHVTLMRTNVEENQAIARWLADKLNRATTPVRLLLPEGGLSMLDAPGQPFHDPETNAVLFAALESQLRTAEVIRLPHHINDPAFAEALVDHYLQLTGTTYS